MEQNIKKPLYHLINQKLKGVDTYYNNGSMWLIFTDNKKWVIELTNKGTLWYNFYFFQDCFKYLSLDVVENQHYITEWVEDIIQNGVRNTDSWVGKPFVAVEYIIQNGIKETIDQWNQNRPSVKDVIEKGVKETTPGGYLGSIEMKGKLVHQFESPKQNNEVEDTIKNGVKHTAVIRGAQTPNVEDTIKNGVRYTGRRIRSQQRVVEDTIKNGVKETNPNYLVGDLTIEEVIQTGIKETKSLEHDRTTYLGYFNQKRGTHTPLDRVQDVIENGIKEVKELPDQSGELKGYSDYYHRQEDRKYPHTKTVNDVIRDGIKETWGYERQPQTRVNNVIRTGKKFDTQ